MGVVCGTCGETNRDGSRFCASCGTRIVARCGTCDADLADGSRFCDACGAPVLSEHAATDEASRQTRKVVTVVFGDLVGSTTLQERMDPESVRALMGRCYSVLRECTERNGGRVVKFVGDGTMAVFGVPDIAEDDATRALAAGAEMVAAIEALANEPGGVAAALSLRVGINTGEVVVDEDDPDVVGDVVNVAARLEGVAAPGTVLVSGTTWRLTRDAARFAPAELVAIRGRTDPVIAHPLVAMGAAPAEDASPTRFVGRDAELGTLLGSLDAAIAARELRLVSIIGSPGVGKSRLGRELEHRVGGRAAVVRAGCVAGGGAALAPVAELLDGLAALGVVDEASADTERAAVVRQGLAAGEAAPPEELFWAVRRAVEAAASDRPLVLLLEDLHWAEPLLLDLVEHLAEWVRDVPVLLVSVARPELREIRPSLAVPRRAAQQLLTLEGLDGRATEDLARELLGVDEVPAALLVRLGASTDGNPLFVRELIRMLVDDGVLERTGDGWSLTVAADSVEVPPTIQALLAARIDQLGDGERTVLERAAVIGADVYRGALDALVPAELAGRMDELLEGLRRKELLEPAESYWIDERVLRFHHALIRDAAYARLLRQTRAGLHERTARWLDDKTGGSPDHDEAVGFHLEQAQACHRTLGPLDDDARLVAAEAATRLSSAAARALDRDDLSAAASLAGRAMACLDPGDPARADLLITRGEALLGDGQVMAAGPVIDELAELARGDARLRAWSTCFRWQRVTMVDPGGLDDLGSTLTAAADELAELGDLVGAAKAHRVHASALGRLGRVGECEAALDRALSAARASSDRRQITSVLTAAPTVALWGPSPVPRAGGRCLDVIRLVRITTGARVVEATSIRSQAVLESFRGRFDAARSMIGGARHIAEEIGSTNALMEVELSAGTVELCAGDLIAAMDHLRRAQEGLTAMGLGADAAQAASLRARVALRLGQPNDALAFIAESEQLSRQDLKSSILRKAVKAEVLAARGEVTEALALAEEAVALAERTDALVDHADACAALAVVRRAAGDEAGAAAAAADARALYQQKGATALVAGFDAPPMVRPALPDHAVPDVPPVSNQASRALLDICDLVVAGRLEEVATRVASDILNDDKRPGMGAEVIGVDAAVEMFDIIRRLGLEAIDSEVLAVRGERLCLVASTWRGAFEIPLLSVSHLDAEGRIDRATTYAADALADALVDLDDAHLAEEGAAFAAQIRSGRDNSDGINRRDWERVRRLYTPDIVTIDHRPGGYGTLRGADELVDRHRTMVDIAPDYQQVLRCHIAMSEQAGLVDAIAVATSSGGAIYGIARLVLGGFSPAEGLIDRFEYFGPDQLDLAMARYHELVAERSGPLDNLAVQALRASVTAACAGDFDQARDVLADDCVAEDRRPGLYSLLEGGDVVAGQLQELHGLGVDRVEVEVIATRGDRLSLARTRWIGARFEVSALFITDLDEEGLVRGSVCFEEDQLDEAMTELGARAGARAARAPATNGALESFRAIVGGIVSDDRERVRSHFAPACTFVDHRPGLGSTLEGAETLVESLFLVRSLGVDRVDVDVVELRGDRVALVRTSWVGEQFDVVALFVASIDDRGRSVTLDAFEEAQLDEAMITTDRRFHDGEGAEFASWLSVTAPWVLLAHARRDWGAVRSLYSPDAELRDHRPVSRTVLHGADQAVRYHQSMVDLEPTHRQLLRRHMAVHDHLLLSELVSTGTGSLGEHGPTEVTNLLITAHDAQGRTAQLERFEVQDEGAARARFEELVAQGQPQTVAERWVRRDDAAFMAADWHSLDWLWDDDVVTDDRRRLVGAGISDRVQLFEALHFLVDSFGTRSNVRTEVLGRSGEQHIACRSFWRGNDAELEVLFVAMVSEQGRVTRVTFFDPDQVDEALADLAARADAADEILATPSNAAFRAQRALLDAVVSRDFARVRSLLSPRSVSEDRRPGLSTLLDGADAAIENLQVIADLGLEAIELEPLVLRGERLVLSSARWMGDLVIIEMLLTYELDDEGLCRRTNWELDQLDDALIDIEARYYADEGAEYAAWGSLVSPRMELAHARRDWETLRGMYTPDAELRDRRRIGSGTLRGIDAAIEYQRAMVELDPSHRLLFRRRLALADHVTLSEMVTTGVGSITDAGPTELASLLISVQDGQGRASLLERFDHDALATAMERFDAIVAEGHPQTMSERSVRRVDAALLARDWDALEWAYTDDAIGDDRRSTVGIGVSDRATMFEVLHLVTESFGGLQGTRTRVIGRNGEHKVACHTVWDGGDVEVEMHFVTTVDDQGRATKVVFFDADREDDALAELAQP